MVSRMRCAPPRWYSRHRNYLAGMPSVTSGSRGLHAADVPPDRTRTTPRNQPGTAGPAHVALRTFEQKNPIFHRASLFAYEYCTWLRDCSSYFSSWLAIFADSLSDIEAFIHD